MRTNLTMIKNSNGQVKGKGDMGTRKFGGVERRNNRRVLGMINQNLVGGNGYPCVVNRGLFGANGIAGKNLPVRARRPIIRGFAAQVANSQQRCSEEKKKLKIATKTFSVWEDISLSQMLRKMKQLKISLSLCLWKKLKPRQMFLFPFLRTQIGFCKNVDTVAYHLSLLKDMFS